MKYYHRESLLGYRQMLKEGKRTWAAVHGAPRDATFLYNRLFLDMVLSRTEFRGARPSALEIGCGTGPGALYLTEKGFRVCAIDVDPTAIEVAREHARERNVDIRYEVMDVTSLPHAGERFDLIADNYCLQNIVLTHDREKVFAAVHARLLSSGYYLISTCCYESGRHHPEDKARDRKTGRVYDRWDERQLYDPQAEICYRAFSDFSWSLGADDGPEDYEGSVRINGRWYLPVRRYRTSEALKDELEGHGFSVLLQTGEVGGDLVCALAGSSARLSEPQDDA